jgi:cell division protein FtsB
VKALLILAVLIPLAVVVAWYASRPILARKQRLRRIEELEAENARLDDLLNKPK